MQTIILIAEQQNVTLISQWTSSFIYVLTNKNKQRHSLH